MSDETEAKVLVQRHVQRKHDQKVWRDIVDRLRGWKDGRLHDNDYKRLADGFGFQLEAPLFLDELIDLVVKLEPRDLAGNE